MKKILATFLIGFSVLLLCPNYSYSTVTPPQGGAATNKTLEDKLCEIRLAFCNTTTIVLIAFSLAFLGLLILMGKLHWTFAIIMVAGMIVFAQAHNVSKTVSADPQFQVKNACKCIETP